jgi:hypothetical protein
MRLLKKREKRARKSESGEREAEQSRAERRSGVGVPGSGGL